MFQATNKTNMNGNPKAHLQRFTTPETGVVDRETGLELLEQMRPTLLVFLGGTGQLTAVELKALLKRRFGRGWRRKVRLLAFDTTEEPVAVRLNDQLVQLEAGSEFHNIGGLSVPGIVRNLDNLHAIRERLGDVIHRLPASVMRNGAKQIRPLGLLALLWHYPTILTELRRAIWQLAGRNTHGAQTAVQQRGINVFICSSLAGGTGSGTFLDVAYLIRSLFEELGAQGEFSHITGIGVLPQAFPPEAGPNLYPNTAAALKELNHAMVQGDFRARYPDGREVYVPDSPFNLYYVLDGVDEQGRTWSGIEEVTAMAAEAIFLQMASQLGRKGDNAFDNVDEALIEQTEEGDGNFLGSLGLGYLEFPAPAVARLCSLWLLQELMESHWLRPSTIDQVTKYRDDGLLPINTSQLMPALLRDPETGGELHLELHQPGWLLEKSADQVPTEAVQYVHQFGEARVNEAMVGQITQNGAAILQRQRMYWQTWVSDALFAHAFSLNDVRDVLQAAQAGLDDWIGEGRRHLTEAEEQLKRYDDELDHLESGLVRAAASLPFGRRGRLRQALARYFQTAQTTFETRLQQAEWRVQQRIWTELQGELASLARTTQALIDRLETIRLQTKTAIREGLDLLQNSGVSHFGLADEAYTRALYQQHLPTRVNLVALGDLLAEETGQERKSSLQLADLSTGQLTTFLVGVLQQPFLPILQMNIEAVIAARAQEMSPAARRQQLFQLATPSWSVEWARLPEGGARLVRLEVMGIPDKDDTLFEGEPMLVSTHDPYRLMALVVVAGAPQSALKQYDQYQTTMDEIRGRCPLYVLPNFLAEGNQSQLAFGLGSIFGLIHSQGAHFYYQPSDPLQKRVRLGNGLHNAIQALATQEVLVREVMDRVDGKIAQMGLQQAIERLTAYYTVVPEGRTKLDDTMRDLKQEVRQYTDELRQINELSRGLDQ